MGFCTVKMDGEVMYGMIPPYMLNSSHISNSGGISLFRKCDECKIIDILEFNPSFRDDVLKCIKPLDQLLSISLSDFYYYSINIGYIQNGVYCNENIVLNSIDNVDKMMDIINNSIVVQYEDAATIGFADDYPLLPIPINHLLYLFQNTHMKHGFPPIDLKSIVEYCDKNGITMSELNRIVKLLYSDNNANYQLGLKLLIGKG